MPIDFSKISLPRTSKRFVDPIELFQSLKVSDPAINDLWLAQGDALRQWHTARRQSDVAIVLNTGAGKTLVGLLAAQSLVNETNGHVLYACSSIQLVEQTAAKARGYGLPVATYFRQNFSSDLYLSGQAPCITTYQALFNGKSRLPRDGVSAVVFDDAHTAEHLLRDQFTRHIRRTRFKSTYQQITQLFRSFFEQIGTDIGYLETLQQRDPYKLWLVPPFALQQQFGELKRVLLDANLSGETETTFAWEYLKDHIDLCALFVTAQEVSITPPVVPVRTLPYFEDGVRRLYLSATLTAQDSFLRTFGGVPDPIIAPDTTAGACERLIIAPGMHKDCRDEVAMAKRIAGPQKALVLVPTHRHGLKWSDIVTIDQSDDVAEQINSFKRASAPSAIALVARYDGVDLPGDTCRLMIIDELPSGQGPLERYLWEYLGLHKSLRSAVASRVVQSFGRISRGMSDHGVVVVTGKSLISWLVNSENRDLLPAFLQRQLEIGMSVSREASSLLDLVGAAEQCLSRDAGWVNYYQDVMDSVPLNRGPVPTDDGALAMARAEIEFGHALWERDFSAAAKHLERDLDKSFQVSVPAAAWHCLWLGYCYELMKDGKVAHQFYQRAHSAVKAIPPHDSHSLASSSQQIPPQVLEVARYLDSGPQERQMVMARFDREIAALDGTGSPSQAEEAVRALGEYLGLKASRPDHEYGTGPDVLWELVDAPALCLDLKTDHTADHYQKSSVAQLHDHIQWVSDNSTCRPIFPALVGHTVPVTSNSNPSPEMTVIELSEFAEIAERLRAALEDISRTSVPNKVVQVTWDVLLQRGLLWPELYTKTRKTLLA